MIEIRHHILPGVGVIEIRGHAGAAEYGSDVICAAVSALTVTLAERLRRADTKTGSGQAKIVYSRRARKERESAEFAICGYRLLAEKFPDYVHYQEIRGDG